MIIVLTTGGKRQDVDYLKVKLFETREQALDYCIENNDDPMDEKYWIYSEIIEDGVIYEPSRYLNSR